MKLKLLALVALLAFTTAPESRHLDVFFDFDRYELTTQTVQSLDRWAQENPSARVSAITGFCDYKGSDVYNDSLSVKRANAVAGYLREKNVVFDENVRISGVGENFTQAKDQWRNRKVVVEYSVVTSENGKKPDLRDKIGTAKKGDRIKLEGFYFYNMSDRLLPKSRPLLAPLLQSMVDNPSLRIEIQGHICCQTRADANYDNVAVIRAKAIYDFLVASGIDKSRLSYKGFGATRPVHPIPEKNEAEQDENRRVEIEILGN